MKVKICGITREEDALAAIDAGADALGFNFYPSSPRYISPDALAPWFSQLPPFIQAVAVVVNLSLEEILYIEKTLAFDLWQLHGTESEDLCKSLHPRPFIKALRLSSSKDFPSPEQYPSTKAFLVDTPSAKFGGSGETCDWNLAKEFCTREKKPIILSGGLTIDNVKEAISVVSPYGVDVCSGVESSSPQKKDHALIKEFIEKCKS